MLGDKFDTVTCEQAKRAAHVRALNYAPSEVGDEACMVGGQGDVLKFCFCIYIPCLWHRAPRRIEIFQCLQRNISVFVNIFWIMFFFHL